MITGHEQMNKDEAQRIAQLWQFPCDFPVKIMGVADEKLLEEVMAIVQKHAPGEYHPTIKLSKKGNYHSITVNILAKNKEQLNALYSDLHQLEKVKMLL